MYISLDDVLNEIPVSLRGEFGDDDRIRSLAWRALRVFNFPHLKYMYDMDFFDIIDHKVVLPPQVAGLEAVYVYTGQMAPDAISAVFDECECEDEKLPATCMPLYHRLFVSNPDIQNAFERAVDLKNVSDRIVTKTDAACGRYQFKASYDLKTLTISECSGIAAVIWKEHIKDECGLLVPQEPYSLWQYMKAHIMYSIYEEMGDVQRMQMYITQRKAYLDEAMGDLHLRSFNFKVHKQVVYGQARIMGLNQRLHEQYNQYGKL